MYIIPYDMIGHFGTNRFYYCFVFILFANLHYKNIKFVEYWWHIAIYQYFEILPNYDKRTITPSKTFFAKSCIFNLLFRNRNSFSISDQVFDVKPAKISSLTFRWSECFDPKRFLQFFLIWAFSSFLGERKKNFFYNFFNISAFSSFFRRTQKKLFLIFLIFWKFERSPLF